MFITENVRLPKRISFGKWISLKKIFQNLTPISSPPGFAPHLLAAHPFMHPAMMPLYPLQYPAFPMQPQMGSLDDMQQASASQPLSTGSSGTTSKDGSKAEEEDDDANKRDDEETFWWVIRNPEFRT